MRIVSTPVHINKEPQPETVVEDYDPVKVHFGPRENTKRDLDELRKRAEQELPLFEDS